MRKRVLWVCRDAVAVWVGVSQALVPRSSHPPCTEPSLLRSIPLCPTQGVHPGAKLKMIASHAADVAAVQAAQDDRLMPGQLLACCRDACSVCGGGCAGCLAGLQAVGTS